MNEKENIYQNELLPLLLTTLDNGEKGDLQNYLSGKSNLPGPRMNTGVVDAFAELVGQQIIKADSPVERIEELLDGWAALSLIEAPVNDPREILPAAAIASYGQAAISRPDWWEDELGKLYKGAKNPRWRTREIVATSIQRILTFDWERTLLKIEGWLPDQNPLVIRAVIAAVAEPPLLNKGIGRGENALQIQMKALELFEQIPSRKRKDEDVRILRQALGFTLSVAIAAAPERGLPWLEKLKSSNDPDILWIAQENSKKSRIISLI